MGRRVLTAGRRAVVGMVAAILTGSVAAAAPIEKAIPRDKPAENKAPTPPTENYPAHPDAVRKAGVPQGKVTQMPAFKESKVFPGTERDWWIYVPAQYDGTTPACLMVFQDGSNFVLDAREYKVPTVFDNLIASKEMPVTIAVFINPGNDPKKNPPPAEGKKAKQPFKPSNRSFEYDTLSDAYSRFLLDEILPVVQKDYKITDDPEGRAICGNSSGGICAFTVAWERTASFQKVVSHVGSFTDIRGGHNYVPMIRKAPPKPIRIFMQDGENDLDNQFGDWFLSNQQMFKAFAFANRTADEAGDKSSSKDRYDVKFVIGQGGHNGKFSASIFPDTMRWLWRDFPGVKK